MHQGCFTGDVSAAVNVVVLVVAHQSWGKWYQMMREEERSVEVPSVPPECPPAMSSGRSKHRQSRSAIGVEG